ncbi:MAG: gamma-glutamyl-phosphate reductase, partial [Clostridia bacterium]|nr:gamma-glutamyl-phosphate reductase [Clostridia bacterium]
MNIIMDELTKKGAIAKKASYALGILSTDIKNKALKNIASALREKTDFILEENARDLALAKENNMAAGLIDRLKLNEDRINAMAEGIEQIVDLPDPVGDSVFKTERPNGLIINQIRVPLGVIGIIYEARPNVTADATGLCIKAGNAVILRGG